jgi:hypothetical protein
MEVALPLGAPIAVTTIMLCAARRTTNKRVKTFIDMEEETLLTIEVDMYGSRQWMAKSMGRESEFTVQINVTS